MDFAERLKELCKRTGRSYRSVFYTGKPIRTRRDKTQCRTTTKLAKALDTTFDYLMNGTDDDVVQDAGLKKELISRFKGVRGLGAEDKKSCFFDGCLYYQNQNSNIVTL